MNEVTQAKVVESLRTVGIGAGDGVITHAAIQFLGRPVGGVGIYWDAFREVLGPEGTLVVPTFNFGFCRGLAFDRESTPSEKMGVFAEHVRKLPVARRSSHPMQSVAAIGRYAEDLAGRDTASAFDPGSAFDRMLELDFTMVLLGASIQSVSMVHYCEQKQTVPYRFWKEFSGMVRCGGQQRQATYRMYARDLDLDPKIDQVPIQRALEAMGAWKETRLNYGTVAACRLRDFVAVTLNLLTKDPWSLVGNLPEVQQRAQDLRTE
jgi:aminoglycoside N3'-acetyltransferase